MGSQEFSFTSQKSTDDDPDAADKLLALCKADPMYHFMAARHVPSQPLVWKNREDCSVPSRFWRRMDPSLYFHHGGTRERNNHHSGNAKRRLRGFEEPILIKAVPDDGTGGRVSRKSLFQIAWPEESKESNDCIYLEANGPWYTQRPCIAHNKYHKIHMDVPLWMGFREKRIGRRLFTSLELPPALEAQPLGKQTETRYEEWDVRKVWF
jgi:hypothetical protein